MFVFLEKYNIDTLFVALTGIAALVFICIVLKDIGKTNKIIRDKAVEAIYTFSSWIEKSAAFVKDLFLCHIVNNGFISEKEITIDDGYMTPRSSAYIKKR